MKLTSEKLSQWIDRLRIVQKDPNAYSEKLAVVVDEMDRAWVDLCHAELAASDRADLPR